MCSERIGDAGVAPLPERRRVLLGGAAVGLSMMAAGLAGCGGGGPDDDAALRAVNATAHLAQVDLLFNDWRFATAVGYGGQASAYARRPVWSVGAAGLFEVKQTGQTALLAKKILALPEGDSCSVVLTGSQSTGLNMRILDENTPRPAGAHMRLRVLHGLPGHGALDVHITSANQPLAGRRPDLVVLSYQDLSTHATLSHGATLARDARRAAGLGAVRQHGNRLQQWHDGHAGHRADSGCGRCDCHRTAAGRGRVQIGLTRPGLRLNAKRQGQAFCVRWRPVAPRVRHMSRVL